MKRSPQVIFFCVLALAMNLWAAWTGTKTTPDTTRIGEKIFYKITTAAELAWFASSVNGGSTSINAILANDLIFGDDSTKYTSTAWTVIGNSSKQYTGTFDGQGHTIFGLHMGNSSVLGLFGYIGSAGVVKNLRLNSTDKTDANYAGDMIRGGIAAVNYGTISNCENVAENKIYTKGSSGTSYVGYSAGIVGKNYGTISKCRNLKTVHIGDQTWPGTAYAGGIAAYNEGIVEKCENAAQVSSNVARKNYVGGIVSYNTSKGVILQSFNSAAIQSSYDITYSTYSPGAYNGGIVASNEGLISDTYNIGSDSSFQNTGAVYTGGIVGYNSGKSAVVKNSYVAIKKSGAKGSSSYAGAIAGANVSSALVKNCHYDSSLIKISAIKTQSATITNVSGMDSSVMKTNWFAYILNTTYESDTSSKIWSRKDSYPIFADSLHKPINSITAIDGDENDTTEVTPPENENDTTEVTPSENENDSTEVIPSENENDTTEVTPHENKNDSTKVIPSENENDSTEVIPSENENDSTEVTPSENENDSTEVIPSENSSTVIALPEVANDSDTKKIRLTFITGRSRIDTLVIANSKFELPEGKDSLGYEFIGWFDVEGDKFGNAGDQFTIKRPFSVIAFYSSQSSKLKQTSHLSLHIVTANRSVQIDNAPIHSSIRLFDLQGNTIYSGKTSSANTCISVPKAGAYIIRVGKQASRITIR
jgi:hypothetical protein